MSHLAQTGMYMQSAFSQELRHGPFGEYKSRLHIHSSLSQMAHLDEPHAQYTENSRRAQTGLATDSCTAGPAVGEWGRITYSTTVPLPQLPQADRHWPRATPDPTCRLRLGW